ncbi:phospholipid/cholesterol/gamma-HCH transport system permease protein [Pararhizobium capsulatum DSM 1112]|uniref:Phospholipid/cholesterol/gamma-HCH transport system permease protein n=1 Tax=Pararhizobium capsulatum DSM 1112 TaxID=1121113 RepID=A0ABU0BUP0_9HYPH|nr:ABC transporter permease [Pararhizobium capsulatum]MDQ0320557.1 phospholipid/cholesterol/gamma-HCH transport system permease protein [Pararhizobium capsulatum DSM 1112]
MTQSKRTTDAEVTLDEAANGGPRVYRFSGEWRNVFAPEAAQQLEKLAAKEQGASEINLDGVTAMDTAGAWLIRRFVEKLGGEEGEVKLSSNQTRYIELVEAMPKSLPDPREEQAPAPSLAERVFAPVGKVMAAAWNDVIAALFILGSAVRGAQMKLGRHSGLSPAAIVSQIDRMGVQAVPIITLMSFLIGAIIAQQGAFQLRYFGAELFVVDLVGILQLREIGVLLTAIMIAGRSGSAITAEIGSMKMREEIDALKVMGLSPIGVLVFPRLVALTIALPLLTIIANFAALSGAAVVTWSYSGITFATFLARLQEAVDFSSVLAGMIKAPFMALIIGVVAAVEGLKVGGSAESLGAHVTQSVVKAIFVVILVDGLFAMFYAAIDF